MTTVFQGDGVSENKNKQPEQEPQETILAAEMDELKRDMRSAQLTAWIQQNQQQLIAGVVIFLLVMVGFSLWKENQKAKLDAASLLYQQALSAQEEDKKKVLFEQVLSDYPDSGYRLLSLMQLSAIVEDPTHVLQQIVDGADATPAIRWQAKLDMAEYQIAHEQADAAKAVLSERMGKQYEQLRNYLLASLSEGDEKLAYLKKSADAESNDTLLKDKVESMIAKLEADQ